MTRSRIDRPFEHRLAAVWFADIVGYSRLASDDEDAALRLVRLFQAIVREETARYDGTVVKFLGDGALALFGSADAAVRAALALRKSFGARASATGSAAHLRIGVHLGDVVAAPDGDLYGDGVNTAARIQAQTEPGRIEVSEDIWRQLRHRAGFELEPLGERSLKGLAGPIVVYAVVAAPEGPPGAVEAPAVTGMADLTKDRGPRWKRLAFPAALGLVGIMAIVGLWLRNGAEATSDPPRPPSAPPAGAPGSPPSSVAVLPFVDMSPAQDHEYFSDGMSEELIDALSRVPGLRVASRTSSFAFKGKNADIREIGSSLGVEAVVEGSVRAAGDRLRVTAQLIDAESGYHLWSERYDREAEDVFAVQEEIARSIVRALDIELRGDPSLVARPTDNHGAYDLYLRGVFFKNKRTEEGLLEAIDLFEQALEKDPDFALAWAGIATSQNLLRSRGYRSVEETIELERAAVKKALELDDGLSEAHLSLAWIRFNHDWDWQGAGEEFERAVDLDPRNAEARHWYSHYLVAMGRFGESEEESRRALELEPLNVIMSTHLGWHYLQARQYDRAVEQLLSAAALDSHDLLTFGLLAQALAARGDSTRALAECEKVTNGSPPDFQALGSAGYVFALLGRRERALEIRQEQAKRGRHYDLALIDLALGNHESALQELRRGYEKRASGLPQLAVDPRLDALRGDPRFQALVRELGL